MSRSLALAFLVGLTVACSGGDGGMYSLDTDQRPSLNGDPPSAAQQTPTLDEEQPSTSPFSPGRATCEPATGAQVVEALQSQFCEQAVACGQPTSMDYWRAVVENDLDGGDIAYWGYLCAEFTWCLDNPQQCVDDFDLEPAGLEGVCADDVVACLQAMRSQFGCAPTDATFDEFDAHPPPACQPIIDAQEAAERNQPPPDDWEEYDDYGPEPDGSEN